MMKGVRYLSFNKVLLNCNVRTLLSLAGGCHCPRSPFGPNIECLLRVSSFGRWKLSVLWEEEVKGCQK